MRFELFLAARYLKAKRRQAVVGVVTTISVAGVAAGVAALIIALAITNGMRRDLQDRLLGASAHVDLMRVESDGIRDWQPLVDRLRGVPHVTAAAPGLYGQVLVSRGPRAGFALIKGIVPAQERTVSSLLGTLVSGSAKDLEPEAANESSNPFPGQGTANTPYPALVLGKDLAEQIGAQVGDSVLVTSPQGELTPLGLAPQVSALPRGRHLSLGLLSVRRGHGLYAADGRAAPVQRAGPALRDQLQGGRSVPRAGRGQDDRTGRRARAS